MIPTEYITRGAAKRGTMQDMVELIDTKLGDLDKTQIQAVKDMLAGYDLNWNIPNLKA